MGLEPETYVSWTGDHNHYTTRAVDLKAKVKILFMNPTTSLSFST